MKQKKQKDERSINEIKADVKKAKTGIISGYIEKLKTKIREKKKEKLKHRLISDKSEKDIDKVFKKKKKKEKREISAAERKRRLAEYMEKAGLETKPEAMRKAIFNASVFLTLSASAYLLYYFNFVDEQSIWYSVILMAVLWTLGFILVLMMLWLVFRIYLDIKMFKRKLKVEEVLPDFLQLASANLRAGMTIDKALWFAVRPRFGVLAKEIEDVAKKTLSGHDLNGALVDFAKKYDSKLLLRSVNLLNEGMRAGGDVADLLNKVANNIMEMRSMKKEMAASVMTYVIFIAFASLLAAPVLFGLSNQLLVIVQEIAKNVATTAQHHGGGISMNLSPDNIKLSDYKIFAYSSLVISAIFSAIIISTIRKGHIKEDAHFIPIFIIVVIVVFYISAKVMALLLGGMF